MENQLQLNSLKEFLPEWSQNSTLIPIKQDGQIYYIDYSHTNAYDFLTRPLNAAMNGVNQGITNEEGFIGRTTYTKQVIWMLFLMIPCHIGWVYYHQT